MPVYAKVSGTWRHIEPCRVRVAGAWKACQQVYVRVAGAWKPCLSYAWIPGSWSGCSVSCGGGTSTRSVTCQCDGVNVADSRCTAAGLSKPATSQACNTQECETCNYVKNSGASGQYFWRTICNSSACTTTYGQVSVYWNIGYYDDPTVTLGSGGSVEGAMTMTTLSSGGYTYSRSTLQETGTYDQKPTYWYEVCRR